jgi:hypothetical protein
MNTAYYIVSPQQFQTLQVLVSRMSMEEIRMEEASARLLTLLCQLEPRKEEEDD